MKRFFKLIKGRWRLLFGNCPNCNSDAPAMYDCNICDWKRQYNGRTKAGDRIYWWNRFIYYVKLIFLILLLASCTTTKYIDREKVVVDSTVLEQNLALQRTLHETMENHAQEKQQWENMGVVFYENGRNSIDTFSIIKNIPAKIIFDNGKIKSIEGNVRALNQNLYAKSSELTQARNTNDSLRVALANKETKLLRTTVTVTKNIKTKFFPGWAYFLIPVIFLLGSIVESKFKYMARIFSLLKL